MRYNFEIISTLTERRKPCEHLGVILSWNSWFETQQYSIEKGTVLCGGRIGNVKSRVHLLYLPYDMIKVKTCSVYRALDVLMVC